MENKLKHLEFIQAAINRMATTSFLIKGWTITLAAGLIGFAVKEEKLEFLYLTFLVALIFWLLDSYFMKQERLFRSLYDEVRITTPEQVDFSMHTKHLRGGCNTMFQVMFSPIMAIFYFSIVFCALTFIINSK